MARVTVEDCLEIVGNRFELVMVAAKRARQLATTAVDPLVDWENDKVTVVALREVASGHITLDYLDDQPAEEKALLEFDQPILEPQEHAATSILEQQLQADVLAEPPATMIDAPVVQIGVSDTTNTSPLLDVPASQTTEKDDGSIV